MFEQTKKYAYIYVYVNAPLRAWWWGYRQPQFKSVFLAFISMTTLDIF